MKVFGKLYLANRIGRITHRLKPHIDALRKDRSLQDRVERKVSRVMAIRKRIKWYFVARNVFLLLLYASAVSAIAGDVFLLEGISDVVVRVSGLIGATVWLAGVAVLNRLIDLETADAYILASEIIAASPLR